MTDEERRRPDAADNTSRVVGYRDALQCRTRRTSERPREIASGERTAWTRSAGWNIPDDPYDEADAPTRPFATLVSFHYLRAAVRRGRRVWILFALVGMLLAGAYLAANPPTSMATTTLRLTHDPQADPTGAINTDMSLVNTRTVAEKTIEALGLRMSPVVMMNSVGVIPTGSTEVLELTMAAPTRAEAVRRLDAFTKEYLAFRATQISVQTNLLIKGYANQIRALQQQAQILRNEVENPANGAGVTGQKLSDAVTALSQVDAKINTLQGTVDDATLQRNAVVSSSGVIDPAAPVASSGLRRPVLILATGLIGGVALGLAVVALRAIFSDRLWLRIEVASALNAPVLLSARTIGPLPRLLELATWLPRIRARRLRGIADRQLVAHALATAVPGSGDRQCLAVVCLHNSDQMRYAVVAAAMELQRQSRPVTIVDLTDAGTLSSAVTRTVDAAVEQRPTVYRPSVVPSLAERPTRFDTAAEDLAPAHDKHRVTLVVADFDPAIGADHLRAWADAVVVAVTAGRSSVELVRSAGDLVRSAGLDLRGAVLLGTVGDDTSSGLATPGEQPGSEKSEALPRPEPSARSSS